MVQEQSFSGTDWANPYLHLRAFEYLCSCLTIEGMTQETLKWKLFPFSLISFARRWYDQHVASMEGSWERLRAAFCLDFFPLSRTISLRREIFCFEQSEGETIGAAWSRFKILLWSGPDMTIPDEVVIQHFFAGLSSAAGQYLNLACGGSFVHCTAIKCREILDRIQEQFSFNDIHEPVPLTTSVEHASPSIVDEDPVPVPSEDDASSSGSPFHFEDEIFDDYGNTSLYFCEKKPPTLSHLADPIGKADRLDATRKLTHILCDDWLRAKTIDLLLFLQRKFQHAATGCGFKLKITHIIGNGRFLILQTGTEFTGDDVLRCSKADLFHGFSLLSEASRDFYPQRGSYRKWPLPPPG